MTEITYGAPSTAPVGVEVLGRRVLATLVDSAVLLVAALGVLAVQGIVGAAVVADAPEGVQISLGGLGLLLDLTIPLLFVAYFVYFEGRKGQTLGKRVCGIKVIGQDTGGLPGTRAALVRTLLRIVDGLFGYGVGFVFALSSEKRQRLGDKAARTLVVRA